MINDLLSALMTFAELFNLLINPVAHDFALRWHRDDIPDDATEEEESKALGIWHHGVGYFTIAYALADTNTIFRSSGIRQYY